MTSLCATSDNSHGALPIRTPGTKKNGSGLTRAKLFIRTFSASLPTPAGARTWGTSKSPNCEVSIPAASTNLGGDGARLDSERRVPRSEEHTSELQSRSDIVCRLLLEKKKKRPQQTPIGAEYTHSTHTLTIPAPRMTPDQHPPHDA